MFKYVLFAAILAFAAAKPFVVEYEYPVHYESYSVPVSYSHSHYDYDFHPYSAYTYAAPYTYYEYLRK